MRQPFRHCGCSKWSHENNWLSKTVLLLPAVSLGPSWIGGATWQTFRIGPINEIGMDSLWCAQREVGEDSFVMAWCQLYLPAYFFHVAWFPASSIKNKATHRDGYVCAYIKHHSQRLWMSNCVTLVFCPTSCIPLLWGTCCVQNNVI